jgi:hypothetical protein
MPQYTPTQTVPRGSREMRRRRLFPFALLAVFLLLAITLLFSACGKSMPTPSFVYHEEGLLRVNNELHQRFVFFIGAPSRESYIGGVPGMTNDFGLPVPPGRWLITAVKVEEYMMTRTNANAIPVSWARPAIIENGPYTLTVQEGSLFSGRGAILFHNETDGFVEVRNRSWQGTNIATLAPQSSRLQHLPFWDFYLYPVRLDWVTNADGGTFRETRLSNAMNLVALYPDRIEEITISE